MSELPGKIQDSIQFGCVHFRTRALSFDVLDYLSPYSQTVRNRLFLFFFHVECRIAYTLFLLKCTQVKCVYGVSFFFIRCCFVSSVRKEYRALRCACNFLHAFRFRLKIASIFSHSPSKSIDCGQQPNECC